MSLPKAQLVDPQGNMNLPGMTATGVVTATSLKGDIAGSATALAGITDLDVGIVTASSFVGQGDGHAANITGTPQLNLGITTATSFVGDATGKAAGLTGTPNLNVGLITATSFVGFVTGGVTGNVSGDVTGNITGNISGDVEGNVTGNVSGLAKGLGINGINVWTGAGTSNLGVGVCTALELYGDGSALVGAGSSAYIAQEITATGAETIIDLSYGNLIYFDQADAATTTVGFASTSAAEQITFIRNTASYSASWNISYATGGVDFDDTGDYLNTTSASSDFTMGTGDFTVECWVYIHDVGTISGFWQISNTSGGLATDYGDTLAVAWDHQAGEGWQIYGAGTYSKTGLTVSPPSNNTWIHTAYVRSSGTSTLYIDGTAVITQSDTHDYDGTYIAVGGYYNTNYLMDGVISNLRVLKGTALYTAAFIPPSAELTNITNTKLLCCQSDSSTTAAAVTPQTLNAQGDPTAGAQTITNTGTLTVSDYTITWPDRVKWNNDTTPTLITNPRDLAVQVFRFTTVDTGLNYNAWEEIKSDSQDLALFIWGDNTNGGLGQNQPTSSDCSSPTQISGAWKTLVHKSDSGATQSCGAIKTDDTLWLWGRNARYQLGLSDQTKRSSPTQLPGSWSSVKLANAAQGVKTDGTMWSWGYGNSNGAMAQNEGNVQRSSPKQVGTDTDWSHVGKSGSNYFLGIKTDDTLWVCGKASGGRLGLNNLTQRSSPTQLPGNWSQTFACSDYLGGLKTDGTLWSWGYNGYGTLGHNSQTQRSSPTQIPGTWSDTTGGYNSMGAVKTDGTLWTWGYNAKGNLGHNSKTNYSSPVQLPGTTWRSVDMGYQWTVATKTDGTMWAFGSNSYGRLGINIAGYPSAGDRSSPTQVTGTNWGEQVSLGERVSVATKLA